MTGDIRILNIVVRDRNRIVYEGQVKAITSLNERGPFDVLGEHENFISIIKDTLILHSHTGEKTDLKLSKGIMKVYENTVRIYLDVLPQFTTK